VLVSTEWLEKRLDDPDLVVFDMRWREDGSAQSLYETSHIPGARFLDWSTDLVDTESPTAFMLAPAESFAASMARCGIGQESRVVAYADQHGSGPYRLWWASRVYGHDEVSVLDGGFDKWAADGRPLSSEIALPRQPTAPWTARAHAHEYVASADDVAAARDEPETVVLDSRPSEQFRGVAVWFELGQVPAGPDGIAHTPRGDLRAGHVPWAASVPAADLYRPDFTMKPREELAALFESVGALPTRKAITYCGCGISASALLFALTLAGVEDVALYDASWEEWGRDELRPVSRDRPS
jgi:thiosulfate/3-mercaptopyruvate sulfurtransferase